MTKEQFTKEQERLQSELALLRANYIASQPLQVGDMVEVTDTNNKAVKAEIAKALINHKNEVRFEFTRIKATGESWATPIAIPYTDNNSIKKI